MPFKSTIPDAQKRRAVELKNQGWTAKAVGKETGLNDMTVSNNWRKWAEELDIPVPEPEAPAYNPPGPVESYQAPPPESKAIEPLPPVPPLAGLQDKRVAVPPQKQMEDKPAETSGGAETGKAAQASGASPAHRLMQQVNAAVWRYLRATGMALTDIDQKMEITDGTVNVLLTAPAKEAVEHEL